MPSIRNGDLAESCAPWQMTRRWGQPPRPRRNVWGIPQKTHTAASLSRTVKTLRLATKKTARARAPVRDHRQTKPNEVNRTIQLRTLPKVNERYRDFSPICPEPLRYTVIPSGKNRETKTRRNGYPRRVWGFCARSRDSRRDYLSFCWQKR